MNVEPVDIYIDRSVRPQDDFFQFANGKWLETTEIPADKSSWGTFAILREKSLVDVKGILENEYDDQDFKKAALMYKVGLNTTKLNQEGLEPLQPYLTKIDSIDSKDSLLATIIDLTEVGLTSLLSFGSSIDRKNTEIEAPHIGAGGLSLPNKGYFSNRDYYLSEDKAEIRKKYVAYLAKLLSLAGESNTESKAQQVLAFETELAKTHYTQIEKRNPELSYNKMNADEIAKNYPNFAWDNFYKAHTDVEMTYLIVGNPNFVEKVNKLLENPNFDEWKLFLKAKALNLAASYLNAEFFDASFDFYNKTMQGQQQPEERWKFIMGILNSKFMLGDLVGKQYVKEFFPSAAKEAMIELVENLRTALHERLKDLDWMGEETKAKALEKLAAFNVKVGYPDSWEDFSALDIKKSDSFLEMVLKTRKFMRKILLKRIYKAPDKDFWAMSPQMVNAYYSPTRNEIVFPAAILQFPFFDLNVSAAENYGAIGGVIGHEMTHGYDDMGSKFDAKGNMVSWWTEEDRKNFDSKAQHYIDEYEKFLVNGKPLIGKLTLGENLADNGGIRIAFHALQKHFEKHGRPMEDDEYTPEQKFFLAWARAWRTKSTPEVEEQRRMTDPHSPPKARVNVAFSNTPEFQEVWQVNVGDKLYKEKLVKVW